MVLKVTPVLTLKADLMAVAVVMVDEAEVLVIVGQAVVMVALMALTALTALAVVMVTPGVQGVQMAAAVVMMAPIAVDVALSFSAVDPLLVQAAASVS